MLKVNPFFSPNTLNHRIINGSDSLSSVASRFGFWLLTTPLVIDAFDSVSNPCQFHPLPSHASVDASLDKPGASTRQTKLIMAFVPPEAGTDVQAVFGRYVKLGLSYRFR